MKSAVRVFGFEPLADQSGTSQEKRPVLRQKATDPSFAVSVLSTDLHTVPRPARFGLRDRDLIGSKVSYGFASLRGRWPTTHGYSPNNVVTLGSLGEKVLNKAGFDCGVLTGVLTSAWSPPSHRQSLRPHTSQL